VCDDETGLPGEADLHGAPEHRHPTRRALLAALGALSGAAVLPLRGAAAAPRAATVGTFTGFSPVRAAMHVHGSWSEGLASWEQQLTNASQLVDLVFMTDHDFRARAHLHLTSLKDVPMVQAWTGRARQQALTRTGGAVRLLTESAGVSASGASLAVEETPTAWNRLRTSIAGQTLLHTFGATRLTNGARYEVVVALSLHPAFGTRPAGQFQLRYRFRPGAARRVLENGGLTGVVAAPAPPPGTVVRMDLTRDVRALWPDMLAQDNAFTALTLAVTSPRKGAVADVVVKDLRFERTQNDEASVVRNQQAVLAAYAPRFPRLTVQPAVEVSRLSPHLNLLGSPQRFPDQEQILAPDRAYARLVAETHAQGGVVSYNHPFGATTGPLLAREASAAKRRQVFVAMLRSGMYGADVLEVGYQVRGGVTDEEHLRLWDTLSRHAVFVTGNGVNDDHSGASWTTLNNGFQTGIWAPSTAMPDVRAALLGGRAYAQHPRTWPGGQLDVLVDDALPMGSVTVGGPASRTVALSASALPADGVVQLVVGAVDHAGEDPSSVVAETLPASAFTGSGTVSWALEAPTSCFVRAQVRNAAGRIVGIGNPVWLLQEEPPAGVPEARRV